MYEMSIKDKLNNLKFSTKLLELDRTELNKWNEIVSQYSDCITNDNTKTKIIDYRNAVSDDYNAEIDQINNLYSIVKKLDSKQQAVIISRFFQNKTMCDVAKIIGYSMKQTWRIHNKALTELERIMQETAV